MILTQQNRMCDVCRLVDFDTTIKLCGYCSLCDAWICSNCNNNWIKRLKAAVKRKLEPGYNGRQDYIELITKELGHERTGTDNNISSS